MLHNDIKGRRVHQARVWGDRKPSCHAQPMLLLCVGSVTDEGKTCWLSWHIQVVQQPGKHVSIWQRCSIAARECSRWLPKALHAQRFSQAA